jgi:glycine cleavage system H lipoate-binding protein
MFPGVDGFHWTFGHILFLALFFSVVIAIGVTVVVAVIRTVHDFRARRASSICWKVEFSELPEPERRCRHEIAGRVDRRTCPNAFECGQCPDYSKFSDLPPATSELQLGLALPSDRFYHRGHTWVRRESDGTATVGLDDLASRLIGDPEQVELPAPGTEIEHNGVAWSVVKQGKEIRVRAPINGTVVEQGGTDHDWYLKVRPRDPDDLRHLLRGAEVSAWMNRELERLQLQLRQPGSAPSLADGGTLVHGLMDAMPGADWDTVLAATFLEA